MKYVCLSYLGPINWETMSEPARKASMDKFFAWERELRKKGHLLGGMGLQSAQKARTLRFRNGKVAITMDPTLRPKRY